VFVSAFFRLHVYTISVLETEHTNRTTELTKKNRAQMQR